MFTGSLVAIVTPFKNGKLDERALGDLIEWQINSGTHGIVPCGTTGESATLTHAEHDRVVAFTVEVVRRRVPVVAGTGSNSTEEAIALTKHAKAAGVGLFAQIPDDEAHEQDQTGKQHGHRDIGELFFRHAVLLQHRRAPRMKKAILYRQGQHGETTPATDVAW